MQQENKDTRHLIQSPLSDVWQELLGGQPAEVKASQTPAETIIPTLESDPWSALLQANGIEIVDLQQLHLHMSDQDVEQILQIMQEQSAQDTNKPNDT
jgi:hypothetical protein